MCQFIISSLDRCHTPIFQRKKPRLGGMEPLAQADTPNKWWSPWSPSPTRPAWSAILYSGRWKCGAPIGRAWGRRIKMERISTRRIQRHRSQWLTSQPPTWARWFLLAVSSFLISFPSLQPSFLIYSFCPKCQSFSGFHPRLSPLLPLLYLFLHLGTAANILGWGDLCCGGLLCTLRDV